MANSGRKQLPVGQQLIYGFIIIAVLLAIVTNTYRVGVELHKGTKLSNTGMVSTGAQLNTGVILKK